MVEGRSIQTARILHTKELQPRVRPTQIPAKHDAYARQHGRAAFGPKTVRCFHVSNIFYASGQERLEIKVGVPHDRFLDRGPGTHPPTSWPIRDLRFVSCLQVAARRIATTRARGTAGPRGAAAKCSRPRVCCAARAGVGAATGARAHRGASGKSATSTRATTSGAAARRAARRARARARGTYQ